MTTDDAPDFHYNSQVDIIAQSLTELSIDIAKQTLSEISVDIVAATLGALNIDITAQSIGSIDIDVVAQTLDHLFNRPTYGGANMATVSVNVGAGATETLAYVAGQGKIYGGHFLILPTISHITDICYLQVDGNWLCNQTIAALYSQRSHHITDTGIHLNRYDVNNHAIGVGVINDITFESSLYVGWYNSTGTAVTVTGYLVYATT